MADNPFLSLPAAQQSENPFMNLPANQEKMSQSMAGVIGFNTGVENFTHGVMQPIYNAIGGNVSKASQQVAKEREADYQQASNQYPLTAGIASVAGGVGATLPLAVIPGVGQTGLARAATSGLMQGAATGAGQYVNEGDSRLKNAFVGGLVGAGTTSVLQGIGKAGTKAINAYKGNYGDPAQAALIAAGKQHNVPVYAPDIANSSAIKNTGRILDEVPVIGMQGERQAQMMAAKNAAENVVGKAKDVMDETAFGGRTGMRAIEQAAKSGGSRGNAANTLLDDIKASGDDWNRIMQTSGNVNLFRAKLLADQKYAKVANMADQFGGVPLNNTMQSIDDAINTVSQGITPNKDKLLGTLQTIKGNMSNRDFNYSQLRSARSEVGSLIDDYFTGDNAAIGKQGVGSLQALKGAIGGDLDAFAQKTNPQLKTVWKNADNFYGNFVAPAKDRLLAGALKNANPDEVYGKFIGIGAREGGKGTGRAQTFYNALDNKGKAAVKYGMVSDAFEKAYKGDANQFSPAQFASELDRHAAAKGVFFKGSDKVEIDGFKNLMRHVERSHQVVNKPDTGIKTIPYLIGGALSAGSLTAPGTTASIAATTYGLKKLFTTEAGKKLLFSSSVLKPGSEGMEKAAQILQRMLQQSAVVGATQ